MKACGTLASHFGVSLLWLQYVSAAGLTDLVNLFIGTASGANGGSGGNVFPGAAVPHAMVKVRITSVCHIGIDPEYHVGLCVGRD
jgi:hypothetical protein